MEKIEKLIKNAELEAKVLFEAVERTALYNQRKVLDVFREFQVSYRHFAPTTGYGYDDVGRDTLQKIVAHVLGAEDAIVSPNLVSGTHTLTVALFGLLKTGDRLLCVSGAPYDTLEEVICGTGNGSLKDYGVDYRKLDLDENGHIQYEELGKMLSEYRPNVVMLTRSRGYNWRNAISLQGMEECADYLKKFDKNIIFMVDNCYGEFVFETEPTQHGVDIIAGSLIKNPGGGIAPTGGYIAGKAEFIQRIGYRLTSPSIGTEVGSYAASYQPFYQGLFLAPSVVANALKGSILAGHLFAQLGYKVSPMPKERPGDIIRAIEFQNSEDLIRFCQGIQYVSPIDSHVTPFPWDMPGYQHQVIMAAGTFVQGSSIELSADSPIKAPYIAYLQGGITYEHCKIAMEEILHRINANK